MVRFTRHTPTPTDTYERIIALTEVTGEDRGGALVLRRDFVRVGEAHLHRLRRYRNELTRDKTYTNLYASRVNWKARYQHKRNNIGPKKRGEQTQTSYFKGSGVEHKAGRQTKEPPLPSRSPRFYK